MEKLEQLRRNTEKAYQSALNAMIELVNAITEERNYYRDLCNGKDGKGLRDQFSEEGTRTPSEAVSACVPLNSTPWMSPPVCRMPVA